MKAIVNTSPGRLEWLDWPLPEPGPGQVRVRVAACAICATDLIMIGGWDRTGFPSIPGHEWSGIVDAVGQGVRAELVGRKCVAENVLADGGEVGFEHPGGYAQFLVTAAANVQTLDEGFGNMPAASLIEPAAVCCRALGRLTHDWHHTALGRTLIFGDGPIGLILVAMLGAEASTQSANVSSLVLAGGRQRRLALANELWQGRSAPLTTINYHDIPAAGLVDGILQATARDFASRL